MKRTLPAARLHRRRVSCCPDSLSRPAAPEARAKACSDPSAAAELPPSSSAGEHAATPAARAVKVTKARIGPDGLAVPPPSAPPAVVRIIKAGNEIATKPYTYGGGHGIWDDSGYDCSGSVSYALHGAGLLDVALDSSGLAAFGQSGPGRWVVDHGQPRARLHGGSGRAVRHKLEQADRQPLDRRRGSTSGYAVRHPPGL